MLKTMGLGQLVKGEREKLGLSQQDFAERVEIPYEVLFEIEETKKAEIYSAHFQKKLFSPLAKIAVYTNRAINDLLREELESTYKRIEEMSEEEMDGKIQGVLNKMEKNGQPPPIVCPPKSYDAKSYKQQLLRLFPMLGYEV